MCAILRHSPPTTTLSSSGEDLLPDWVTVRGRLEEEVVLCTPEGTYDMKFVGISNSMFLIAPGRSYSVLFHNFFLHGYVLDGYGWVVPGFSLIGSLQICPGWEWKQNVLQLILLNLF